MTSGAHGAMVQYEVAMVAHNRLLTSNSQPRCCVCDAEGEFPYDARFDGPACDACHALLTIRDDVFRRLHPEYDAVIRSIWHDLRDPAQARDVGRRYARMGYWDDEEEDEDTPAAHTARSSVGRRSSRHPVFPWPERSGEDEDDGKEDLFEG
ncbi:MAG: hypothetical protein M1296_07100 [Chloroflexi bacterium]|nr:hypothetical protein [Chloroflexota bacterium]